MVASSYSFRLASAIPAGQEPEARSARVGELPVFDMGPGLDQLLERCQEETGLPAPKAPVWL